MFKIKYNRSYFDSNINVIAVTKYVSKECLQEYYDNNYRKYEKFNGCLLNAAPELDGSYDRHVDILNGATDVGIIILGTKNTVTRAGKVLPPEKMRDYVKFADNYYGREIYGRMIACPEACVIAFVKVNNEFTVVDAGAPGLFVQFPKQPITRDGVANVADNYPQLANKGYMNEAVPEGGYATNAALQTGLAGKIGVNDEIPATQVIVGQGDTAVDITHTQINNVDVLGKYLHAKDSTNADITITDIEASDTDSDSDTDTDIDTDTDPDAQ